MAQVVVADAKTMAADISTSGKVAIYGIILISTRQMSTRI